MRKFLLLLILLATFEITSANPIRELIERIAPGSSVGFELILKPGKSKLDYFELSQNGDKVVITGNNNISLATGFNWYVKYYAHQHISWNNMKIELPSVLPPVEKVEYRETNQLVRYYLNYCTFSYSMAFWDWERWQMELDWMALHGINLSLAITGVESVWFNLLERLGYTPREIDQFIAGPAYMAWWQMGNLEGWGGPNSAIWYKDQMLLQKQIIGRMHELGIEPVLPGYGGMLPHATKEKQRGATINTTKWCGFTRPDFLQPTHPDFEKIAALYYEELTKMYGQANYYAVDPFHESGDVAGVDLELTAKSIMKAMKRANKSATWVIQAWQANPRRELISSLKRGDLLILDLYSESRPMWGAKWSKWYREEGYGKHDWVFNMLLNFGGRTGMHGKLEHLIDTYYEAKRHEHGKSLKGVGATMEAIENNPVMFELLYELPWREDKFRANMWLRGYIAARYGVFSEVLYESWKILKRTVYNCPPYDTQEGTTESVFAALPGPDINKVSCCSSIIPYYNTDSVKLAVHKFLSVSKEFRDNPNYQYDLVDLVRQAVSNRAYYLYKDFQKAYQDRAIDRVKAIRHDFLTLMLMQDKLLTSHPSFMVGTWINQAREKGRTRVEKDRNEWNARSLISVWGKEESAFILHNYAYKEWAGVLKDLYFPRWRDYFTDVILELETDEKQPPIDYFKMDERWTRLTNPYPNWSLRDPINTSIEIFSKYIE